MSTVNEPGGSGKDPYFTVSKSRMKVIINKIEGTNAAYASAVFVALRWIANNNQYPNGPLETTIGSIARHAGLSYNKAGEMLNLLEKIGVIAIERREIPGTKANAPSIYTFPTIGGTFPTEHPPRRAEIGKEGKESKSIAPAAEAPGREGNELFDAFVTALGSDPAQLTKSAKGSIRGALKEIRDVCPDVTPAEFNRRAANYRKKMPRVMLTAPALAKHWSACDSSSNEPQRRPDNLSPDDLKW